MKVVYISKTCSREKYSRCIEEKNMRASQQAQKYNLLLAEGMVHNGIEVDMVSTIPINNSITKKAFFSKEREFVNGIKYCYVAFINKTILRSISFCIGVIKELFQYSTSDKEIVFLCDALNLPISVATLIVSKIRKIKSIAIVTDVPCYRPSLRGKIPLHERLNLWLMKNYDGYLLLTEQMSAIVNPNKKPTIILEGHADKDMRDVENSLYNKYDKKVCLYAGSLRRIYGIENLVKGFVKANIPETELHIYGDGDFVEELKKIVTQNSNIKYKGVKPNEEVLLAELKSTLLINPRPTTEEYTKYSFPSKNMEYMASGTPVLTTKLPGMPLEYNNHVYLIEEESVDGIKNALETILILSDETLFMKGAMAKEFVLNKKNNDIQANKVIKWLESIL